MDVKVRAQETKTRTDEDEDENEDEGEDDPMTKCMSMNLDESGHACEHASNECEHRMLMKKKHEWMQM